LIAWAGTGTGCDISSHSPPVQVQLPGTDGQPGPRFDASSCARYPDFDVLDRACSIDSNGKTYPVDGTLWIMPAAPPYAGYFHFRPGYVPLYQDIDSTSPAPSIRVLAAPALTTAPCCLDESVTLRPPVQITMTPEGGMLVTISDALPVGDEVRITLLLGGLYKHQVAPCMLPNPTYCTMADSISFGLGFDVGAGPGGGAPLPHADAGTPSPGACLLEYNDALASGDACCYRQHGANTCDRSIKCNSASGSGCCVIYGTANTAGGSRCCLYESGDLGDNPDECSALLAQSR